jgi:hypothetical protein
LLELAIDIAADARVILSARTELPVWPELRPHPLDDAALHSEQRLDPTKVARTPADREHHRDREHRPAFVRVAFRPINPKLTVQSLAS